MRQKFRLEIVLCPLLSINFFRYQKFSGKEKGYFTKFFVSVLWGKKFRQNRDAPSYASKFSIKDFLKHQSALQWNISVQWDKNFSTENRDTPPPPLIHKIFFPTRNCLKHRMVPWRSFFGPVRLKKISTKPWSFPLLCLKNFDTRMLSKNRRVLLRILSALWDKDFSTEFSWHPLVIHKILRYTKFSETPKCSLTKFFGTVWQKVFDEETWYPPPLSDAYNFSIPEIFWNTEVFPNKVFRYCVTKSFRRRNLIPPLSDAYNFSIPEIFWYTEVFPNEIFRYCETKNFDRKVVIPPPLHKI